MVDGPLVCMRVRVGHHNRLGRSSSVNLIGRPDAIGPARAPKAHACTSWKRLTRAPWRRRAFYAIACRVSCCRQIGSGRACVACGSASTSPVTPPPPTEIRRVLVGRNACSRGIERRAIQTATTVTSGSTTMTQNHSSGPNPPTRSSPSSADCLYLPFESVH